MLLYDGECRFCRFAARAVVLADRRHRIALLPLEDGEALALLGGLGHDERMRSMHVVEPDGRRFSAGPALGRLVSHLGSPRAAGALARLYEPVARNRARLGRLVPDGRAPRRYP